MTTPLEQSARPASISRTVLRVLIKLNLVFGVLILALLIASLIAGSFVFRALGAIPSPDSPGLFFSMRGIMVIGILAVPVVHVIYTRLLAIVETVNVGNPFVVENAARLQTIAWSIVGLEVMHIAVIVLANRVWVGTQKVDIDSKFPLTSLLTVLLLFVLAGVFDQGARMRDELEATV